VKRILIAALAGLLMALTGCASKPPPRIFWPTPPADPKLEFIGVYQSQDDLSDNKLAKAVLGESELGKLYQPFDVVADGKGLVYLSETQNGFVKIFDFNTKKVRYFLNEPVGEPLGLALDSHGRLFIGDQRSHRVLVYSTDGRPLFSFGGPEELDRPYDIAINERLGRIYVSDDYSHHVVVYNLDGVKLFDIGERGVEEGQFIRPAGIAIDKENRVFIADHLNARIQVFDADGVFQYAFGERGAHYTNFEAPKGLAFDSEGNLWITDFRKGLLLTYSPEGKMLLFTGIKEGAAKGLVFAFNAPLGLFIDANDRIYVADHVYSRLSVWQYLSEGYLSAHPLPEKSKY